MTQVAISPLYTARNDDPVPDPDPDPDEKARKDPPSTPTNLQIPYSYLERRIIMKNAGTAFAVFLMSFLLLHPSISAQQPAAQGTTAQEIESLATRTGEVVELLRLLVAQRDEDLQLKRLQVAILALQLRSSTIGDIQDRILTLEDRTATAKEELTSLDAEIQRLETVMAGREEMPELQRQRLQASRNLIETQIDVINQRIWTYERQILDLQNDLTGKRRNVDALEEIVMEGLSEF
jgi:hypothetical protein